jgi:hypothetical protein
MFRHPKYYKELRKLRNKLDQAISLIDGHNMELTNAKVSESVRPGPGLKQQASSSKQQASSRKRLEAVE